MINQIDFRKLLPYDGSAWQSFEMLCYVIAKRLYPNGNFTPINGKGGDGGIEFYQTLPSGKLIIWQCKYFDKLEKAQKTQIEKSYETAAKNHGKRIKKWVICSPIDFTPAGDSWFKDFCNGKISIEAWGESELVNYLSKMPDVCNFFFNAKHLTQKWFQNHASLMLSNELVKNKYLPEVHYQTEEQHEILGLLDSSIFEEQIAEIKELYWWKYYINGVKWNSSTLKDDNSDRADAVESMLDSVLCDCNSVENILQDIVQSFDNLQWNNYKEGVSNLRKCKEKINATLKQLQDLKIPELKIKCSHISKILEIITVFIKFAQDNIVNDVHIIGDASSGKSHIAIDTVAKYESHGVRYPSVLILAKTLNSGLSAETAILDKLDLNKDYNFDDFLSSLDIASDVLGQRALIVIDGLNELYGSLTMWKRDLPLLLNKISSHPNILLVLTYRQSYTAALGLDKHLDSELPLHLIEITGFERTDVVDVISAYFRHFGISVKGGIPEQIYRLFSAKPILLRLFCETNKGNKGIDIGKLSLIEIFEQYLSHINKKLIDELNKDSRFEKRFLFVKLYAIAQFLWDNSTQSIPIEEFVKYGTTKDLAAIDGEDLLVIREYDNGREAISFTFDILGGYLISKFLLSGISNMDMLHEFINSDKFQNELIRISDKHHPLKDVILDNFIRLSLLKFGFCYNKDVAIPYSLVIPILFEMPYDRLGDSEKNIYDYTRAAFLSEPGMLNNVAIVNIDDERHPLNVNVLTCILLGMPMNLRDLTLAEGLRNNKAFKNYIINGCVMKLTALSLSTTDLVLRRTLAEKLYKFAVSNPLDFIRDILPLTLCDDEYVQEGILGVLYGACLRFQDIDDKLTTPATEAITSLLTSHVGVNLGNFLVRNYIRLIIKLANRKGYIVPDYILGLLQQPDYALIQNEIESWPMIEHELWPMYHDFSNYTLGGIIPDGGAYSNPPLKQRGRWYILEQIRNQGWDAEVFGSIDRQIDNSNYRTRADDMDGKVERYGKKYSWIGYYRLAKILDDANLLDTEWFKWRIPEVKYDPTFPAFGTNEKFVTLPLLGDVNMSNNEWIKTPFDVALVNDLLKREIAGDEYVCLWGQYSEKNEEVRRKHLVFIKGIIVTEEEAGDFAQNITSNCDNYHIRDCYDVTSSFGAEFDCWSECTPNNEHEVNIRTGEITTKIQITEENWHEYLGEHNIGEEIEERGYLCKDYQILNPAVKYLNESDGQNGDYFYLAKELKKGLCLKHNPNSNNLLAPDGKEAIKIYQYLPEDFEGSFTFFFIKKDLLQEWLKKNGKNLVWLLWGEKETWDEDSTDLRPMHHYESFNTGIVLE